jgi:hypothetical protein
MTTKDFQPPKTMIEETDIQTPTDSPTGLPASACSELIVGKLRDWLKNLPKLEPTEIVEGREQRIFKMPPSADRWKLRSATYAGIAQAMADQWSDSRMNASTLPTEGAATDS